MNYSKFILVLFTLLFNFCLYSKETKVNQALNCQNKEIFGRIEKGFIKSVDAKFTIKMDTGAKIASLDVKKLVYFTKNNEKWVRFTITSRAKRKKLHKILIKTDVNFERPILDIITIKKHFKNQKVDQRPVVNLDIQVGNVTKTIAVNLVSRKNFLYPMLFGRTAINEFKAVIDPQKKFVQKLNINSDTSK
tara:strand:+ start:2368 stop:2940 length:573 start_codon:yes stop_codon:yes gene_type:complete